MSVNDFQRIGRVQADYSRCIDEGPLEQWPDFFVENCMYRITTAQNYSEGLPAGLVWANTRRMLVDRVSALREANIYEQHTYRHILGQPSVLEENGDGIHAETSFLVVRVMRDGQSDIFASGRYVDRYVDVDDQLKIAERVVVCDSTNIDTLLALPL
ncbi:aromatic-ring-hydroxylating dioxygenase subunit beta [Rhodococcus opacus]|jgi:anthranilate 1,2-dioxygenase small subunit|uniref:Terephthalate 1,2-dioxygenase beta subunit n=3 Tax=Rhodococcus TaxID=1827 RepID=Q0RWE5_RHOJR|nr:MULTISPECIES: aromatic-ring-hydroxylating dioxygenase subunit beta [Rhodococcus]ELB91385.1 aromatic ring dioxygenase beta subunit [Rhodococcus wratislaviensis IFP 2016]NHU44645.1 aromatic-ring-hydroxylating dioxygenase subunit beta [Rhodococcus sp. A14]AAR90188.1 putative terephthalate 1,2-dioxygenase [Rhodococcus sp. DK17]ABG99222.1 terephthalate 1,2-dioxygenase beta subunit [Rhodococcus jostii RHA1]ABH00391.1 terephthalate 1,2-dioxygenase beta subunit [Rhodococcus jostii RHA1]